MTTLAQLRAPGPQPVRRPSKDPAHLPLHRRLLFPYEGIDSKLPQLVEGQGDDIAIINDKLYHLIALALRAYVLSWYTRISPRDRALVPSINSTVITPLLQPTLTSVYHDTSNILNFILLDIPTLLHLHVTTYRDARHQESLDLGSLGDSYHARLPLLSVEKKDEEWQLSPLYLTSLADSIMKNGLSVEEYGSTVERLMVRELIGRTILGGVGRRLSEAWFWYGLLLKFIGGTMEESKKDKEQSASSARGSYPERLASWVVKTYSLLILIWTSIVSIAALYTGTPTPRPEHRNCTQPWLLLVRSLLEVDQRNGGYRPIVQRLLLGSLETVVYLSSPVLDRLIPHLIKTRLLTPRTSISLIDLLERILFPLDGYPAPTPPDPTPEEVVKMRQDLDKRLERLVPERLKAITFPDGLRGVIDPISSRECNAHLIGMLLDSVIAAILPELLVGGR